MIIAVANQKGGVNKTTLTFNMSYIVADKGHKVLMIDFDPQGSLTEIAYDGTITTTIFDALRDNRKFKDTIVNISDNLDMVLGGINLANFDLEFGSLKGRESMLKNLLKQVSGKYDYIVIDCPPSLGLLLVNALNASDQVVIPLATDFLSYKGFDLLLNTIAQVKVNMNPTLNIMGVIATMHDGRTLHNREVLDLIIEEFDVLGVVGISTKVKDATMAAMPMHRYDANHKISKEYERIARRIMHNGNK